jgi:hypothetical protein
MAFYEHHHNKTLCYPLLPKIMNLYYVELISAIRDAHLYGLCAMDLRFLPCLSQDMKLSEIVQFETLRAYEIFGLF